MRVVLSVLGACVLCACANSDGEGGDSSQIGAALRLDLSRIGGVIAEVASITIPYTEADAEQRIANVVADLDDDGMIADYAAAGSTQTEWILRNLPVMVGTADRSTSFRLVDVAVATAPTVRVRVVLSDVELAAAPPLGTIDPDSVETDVAVFVTDRPLLAEPAAGFVGGGGGGSTPDEAWVGETAGTDLDLGSVFYRPGLPDVSQGQNSCVLHTLAGSISWLARVHGFEDKINDVPRLDVSTPEGVNEFAFEIDDVGQLGYTPQGGVPATAVFPGKNQYVQAKRLPIETRQVTSNLFAEIQQAMRDRCTVELVITFADGGAHMVGVAGFSDIQLPSGPSRTVTVHDTETNTFNDTYPVEDQAGTDTLPQFPFRGRLQTATLQFIIVECYKPLLIPGPEDAVNGMVPVPCLVINGRNYPLYQFRLGNSPTDVCTEPHWHADQPVFPLDPPAGQTGETTDPASGSCGFGLEAAVPQSVIQFDLTAWQMFLASHPPPP